MNAEMIQTYHRMKRELDAAARIQRSLLPTASPLVNGVRVAWDLIPCDELAGDSLNVRRLDDRHLSAYILDVSGHGLEAALLAVTLHRVIDALSGGVYGPLLPRDAQHPIVSPAELCNELNRIFPMDPENSQYFTLLYGVLDARERSFRYVAAGHPAPVYVPPAGEPREDHGRGFPVGVVDDARYEESVISIDPGGRLYFYSDGLVDAECSYEGPFGKSRLIEAIDVGRRRGLSDSVGHIIKRVRYWSSTARLEDDASLLALEVG